MSDESNLNTGEAVQGQAAGGSGADLSRAVPLTGVYFLPAGALPGKSWFRRHLFLSALLIFGATGLALLAGANVYDALGKKAALASGRLGVVRVDGMIMESAATVDWIDRLLKDKSIRGALVRINSPGGAVAPSQEIHSALKRLAAVKPVVVSMGSTAASGGYYIAVAAPYIFANPSTLTGSIGVRMDLVNMQQLTDFIGIKPQTLSSGPLKEAGTPYRPMREDERAYLQDMIGDMYEVFVEYVAAGRNRDIAEVRRLADGRAYTGRQALALGLVDEMGDQGAALRKLAEMSGLEQVPAWEDCLVGPKSTQSWLLDMLDALLPDLGLALLRRESPSYNFYY
ncbi:MAG: signal peptide peptidase SppA [Deltaproteobacteria bacterium]|jgi:protease-4|nr:signal peptide peptidase SppA [Deltaproteobacteria bacterium]